MMRREHTSGAVPLHTGRINSALPSAQAVFHNTLNVPRHLISGRTLSLQRRSDEPMVTCDRRRLNEIAGHAFGGSTSVPVSEPS